MKLLYFFLVFTVVATGGFFLFQNINNAKFSMYLIDSIFVALLTMLVIVGIGVFVNIKRKQQNKNVMTIRQYYDFKSVR